MKKNLSLIFTMLFFTALLNSTTAQYCIPATATPYNANMPGITQVILNTIDRTSLDIENFPQNSYVNTGMSTTLQKGETYNITVASTIDAQICPDMNIRVWIDYNQDFDLGDIGETVISADHQAPGAYTGSFTVPSTALGGPTRMRVTSKMSNLGGHSLPTPCDDPTDPLGYHGEIEDYTVEIMGTTDIGKVSGSDDKWTVHASNGMLTLQYELLKNTMVQFDLYNLIGEKVFSLEPTQQKSGTNNLRYAMQRSEASGSQILIAVLNLDGRLSSRKILTQD